VFNMCCQTNLQMASWYPVAIICSVPHFELTCDLALNFGKVNNAEGHNNL
jgi:hypothetical protein